MKMSSIFFLQSTDQVSDPNSSVMDKILKQALDNLTMAVSHKQTNSSALSAVIEVQVETALIKPQQAFSKCSSFFSVWWLQTIVCELFRQTSPIF